MEMRCKKESPVLAFTKGNIYEFEPSEDSEGWETKDDNGCKEVFFDLNIMFELSYFQLINEI